MDAPKLRTDNGELWESGRPPVRVINATATHLTREQLVQRVFAGAGKVFSQDLGGTPPERRATARPMTVIALRNGGSPFTLIAISTNRQEIDSILRHCPETEECAGSRARSENAIIPPRQGE